MRLVRLRVFMAAGADRPGLPGLLFAFVLTAPLRIKKLWPDYRFTAVIAGMPNWRWVRLGRVAVAFAHTSQRSLAIFLTRQVLKVSTTLASEYSFSHLNPPFGCHSNIVAEKAVRQNICFPADRLFFTLSSSDTVGCEKTLQGRFSIPGHRCVQCLDASILASSPRATACNDPGPDRPSAP